MEPTCTSMLERILNNQSVGAFLGAFSAFLLIMLNDWRRERKKVRAIKAEFQVFLSHSSVKLETVRDKLNLARKHNSVSPAPVMPFNTAIVRQLTAESIDRLSLEQRRAIDGLCYRMEATDGLLLEIYQVSQRLSGTIGQAERIMLADRLIIDCKDAIVNLKILNFMLTKYLEENYSALLESKFDRAQFEDS